MDPEKLVPGRPTRPVGLSHRQRPDPGTMVTRKSGDAQEEGLQDGGPPTVSGVNFEGRDGYTRASDAAARGDLQA